MEKIRVLLSSLLIGMVVMLTLNVDILKKFTEMDSKNMVSKVLFRMRRATSEKPSFVRGKCGGDEYGRTGWLASPNFPGSTYPSFSSCNWTISVYPRNVIKFDFVYVDMEEAPVQRRGSCRADYLEIREGPTEADAVVGGQRYCGATTPFNSVYSQSNKVWVYFHADGDTEGQGFAVRWTATDPPTNQFNCDFESVNGLCTGWEQSNDDEFDWTTHHGPTQSGKTTSTGPMYDHTKKDHLGTYAYTEASGRKKGDRAVLMTPSTRVRDPAGYCFRFWYNMRGETMGTLNLYKQEVIAGNSTTPELQFTVSGNFGLKWKRALVNVTTSQNKIRFLFEGVRGSSYKGDMAIDDIKINKGPCPNLTKTKPKAKTTKRTTTKPPKPTTAKRTTKKTTTTTTTTTIAPSTEPGEKCPGGYACKVVGNCVEKDWFCDDIQDCLMNDDEEDCGNEAEKTTEAPSKTWGAWETWSSCSTTCGGGSMERTRECDNGIGDSFLGCIGSAVEAQECNTNKCLNWATWGNWSDCSVSCGTGIQNRSRSCENGNAGEPGCIGPGIEINVCNEHNCPNWGTWSIWSPCLMSCNAGTTARNRICEGGQVDIME